jgi:hypothetical protein
VLSQEFNKYVVVGGYVGRQAMESLGNRIAKARKDYSSFGFLEWAEPFFVEYQKVHPLADIRLYTDEEVMEYNCFGEAKVL